MSDVDIPLEELMQTTSAGRAYGVTLAGFVPKPIGRLLEEKIAAARLLFGDDIDLTSGATMRKLCEMIALEEARVWEHLGIAYADSFVCSATGDALSMLGEEIGIPRPHHRATGVVTIKIEGSLPAGTPDVTFPIGTRLMTDGGHDYFLDAQITLSNALKKVDVPVKAFVPGPESNLDPAIDSQVLTGFNEFDAHSAVVRSLAASEGADVVMVEHTTPTSGGELFWSDETYRDLLLSYPRNLWTPDAIRLAVALTPGVRQVVVKDLYGGLDINQSIFGNFNFIERLFSEERSLGDPYYFTVLVAPGEGAIWDGPGQLQQRVREAIDKVRPIGILPKVEPAQLIGVGFSCDIAVEGLPIPGGTPTAINDSPEAIALKSRILDRVRRYVQALGIGEPVRYSEILWAIMEEPGVVDAKQLRLTRFPAQLSSVTLVPGATSSTSVPVSPSAPVPPGPVFTGPMPPPLGPTSPTGPTSPLGPVAAPPDPTSPAPGTPQTFLSEQDVTIGPTEIADLVESLEAMRLI